MTSVLSPKLSEMKVTSLRSRREHKAWGEAERNPRFDESKVISPRKRAADFDTHDLWVTKHGARRRRRPLSRARCLRGILPGANATGFMLLPAPQAENLSWCFYQRTLEPPHWVAL